MQSSGVVGLLVDGWVSGAGLGETPQECGDAVREGDAVGFEGLLLARDGGDAASRCKSGRRWIRPLDPISSQCVRVRFRAAARIISVCFFASKSLTPNVPMSFLIA